MDTYGPLCKNKSKKAQICAVGKNSIWNSYEFHISINLFHDRILYHFDGKAILVARSNCLQITGTMIFLFFTTFIYSATHLLENNSVL